MRDLRTDEIPTRSWRRLLRLMETRPLRSLVRSLRRRGLDHGPAAHELDAAHKRWDAIDKVARMRAQKTPKGKGPPPKVDAKMVAAARLERLKKKADAMRADPRFTCSRLVPRFNLGPVGVDARRRARNKRKAERQRRRRAVTPVSRVSDR